MPLLAAAAMTAAVALAAEPARAETNSGLLDNLLGSEPIARGGFTNSAGRYEGTLADRQNPATRDRLVAAELSALADDGARIELKETAAGDAIGAFELHPASEGRFELRNVGALPLPSLLLRPENPEAPARTGCYADADRRVRLCFSPESSLKLEVRDADRLPRFDLNFGRFAHGTTV